jgi:basic membrane protein A
MRDEQADCSSTDSASRREIIGALGSAGVVATAGCLGGQSSDGGGSSDGGDSETLNAAFVYDGRIGDQGWIYSHNEGRLAAEEEFDWLETSFQEDVSPEESERVMDDFAQAGNDVIFATSVTFADAVENAADRNPDTLFETGNGFDQGENLSGYSVRYYQARYCCGVAAGMVTETDRIGFIGAVPVPLTFRDINSFALGAQSVNPDITVVPTLTNTFYAPQDATSIVADFANDDIDVIATNLDSTATVSACNDNDVFGCGRDSSQSEAGGEMYLTSALSEWGDIYTSLSEDVYEDTWENDPIWHGFEEDGVALDDFGPNVPDDAVDAALEARDGIVSGDVDVWAGSKFEGQSEAPAGEIRTNMTEYVDAVEGEAP